MNEQYQQLKAVIQAANPEIMELKAGCEFDGGIMVTDSMAGYYDGDYDINLSDNFDGIAEILGRPIRLADVLLAMNKGLTHIAVNSAGCFVKCNPYTDRWELCQWYNSPQEGYETYKWNLRVDNLDHQSDETKQFLIELLISHESERKI